MTTFHENIRNVLSEIDKFLDSLKAEKLAKKVQTNKDKVIELIKKLREDWPALEVKDKLEVQGGNDRDVSNESVQTKTSHGSGAGDDDDTAYGDNVPEKSVKDLTSPIKKGYLDKKRKKASLIQSAFQRRYCVVQDRILYYFEKENSPKQAGAFYLEEYEFREAPQITKDSGKKDLCFELVAAGKRTYQNAGEDYRIIFVAESKEDFQAWRSAITGSGVYYNAPVRTPPGYSGLEQRPGYEGHHYIGSKEDSGYLYPVSSPMATYENAGMYANDPGVYNESGLYVDVVTPPLPAGPPPSLKSPAAPTSPATKTPDLKTLTSPVTKTPALKTPTSPGIIQTAKSPSSSQAARNSTSSLKSPTSPTKVNLPKVMPSRSEALRLRVNPDEDYMNMFYGRWDHKKEAVNELGFKYGDIIHVVNKDYDASGWWVGRLKDQYGLVAKQYLINAYKPVGSQKL